MGVLDLEIGVVLVLAAISLGVFLFFLPTDINGFKFLYLLAVYAKDFLFYSTSGLNFISEASNGLVSLISSVFLFYSWYYAVGTLV